MKTLILDVLCKLRSWFQKRFTTMQTAGCQRGDISRRAAVMLTSSLGLLVAG